jgi:hypothetical protein
MVLSPNPIGLNPNDITFEFDSFIQMMGLYEPAKEQIPKY